MCFQVIELYAMCRCLYYQHPVDRCAAYGKHVVQRRTILVGYACSSHPELGSESRTSTKIPQPELIPSNAKANVKKSSPFGPSSGTNKQDAAKTSILDSSSTPSEVTADFIALQQEVQLHRGQSRGEPLVVNSSEDSSPEILPRGGSGKSRPGACSDNEIGSEDESIQSEAETVISVSSSVTTVDINALDAFTPRLLRFQDLRFLWPQVVHQSGTRGRAIRSIERLIRRYATDVEELASKPVADGGQAVPSKHIQTAAARFVKRSRRDVSRRIYESHCRPNGKDAGESESRPFHVEGEAETYVGRPDDSDESEHDDQFDYNYTAAESFLFETEPILYLQANVRELVGLRHPQPVFNKVFYSTQLLFENVASRLCRPRTAEGKKRVTWTCKCGRQLYDDFEELRPGAVEELQARLRESNKPEPVAYIDLTDSDDGRGNRSVRNHTFAQLWHSLAGIAGMFRPMTLPRHRKDLQPEMELGPCPKQIGEAETDHSFVLFCVPFRRWAAKLHQAEVCRINSDQEFMQVLRHCYATQRGPSAWTRLRKVHSIRFVKFEVYRSQLVDVQSCPAVPPATASTEYLYDPMPADTMPPIGSSYLMHLFEHPEDAEVTPVMYRKIPKKLRRRLEACPMRGCSVGWGIEFGEGMNWFVVFIYGCLGFAMSLLAAVVWAVIRADVQGAFAIAGFLIAFLLFCGGIPRSEIHV